MLGTALINPPLFTWLAIHFVVILMMITWKLHVKRTRSSRKVFLLDFSCYKPPSTNKCSGETVVELLRRHGKYSEETLEFARKTVQGSGLGQSTYLSRGLLQEPPNSRRFEEAKVESEMVIFGAIDEVLAKTGVNCTDIRIVLVNCSIFNVVPSLSSMIVNRYKLGNDVLTYNLQGMGCSAGLAAIGLAKNLLQVHNNSYTLIVSTEIITDSCYSGDDRSKILANCIFRVGGAAVLLSNRPSDHRIAKYHLIHTVQTNTASSDPSYKCIFQEEDPLGNVGINITADLLSSASQAIGDNLAVVGPLIVSISEKVQCLANRVGRYFHVAKTEPYAPNLKKAVDHVFLHVGGKPVLNAVQRKLGLSDADMEASRMTLYRFGNTSSSSVWYELAYAEAKGRIMGGDRLWQMAYGSGFKCSSVIWRAIKTVHREEANPWSDEIDEFPVDPHLVGVEAGTSPYVFKTFKNV